MSESQVKLKDIREHLPALTGLRFFLALWVILHHLTGPGQALTYQIGKLQIMQFLADARMEQGDKFNLRAFHDFLWKNGNVPIALQRWEYLGAADEVSKISGK